MMRGVLLKHRVGGWVAVPKQKIQKRAQKTPKKCDARFFWEPQILDAPARPFSFPRSRRAVHTYDLRLTTYDLRLTTYALRLTTYDLRLTTHDSRLTTYDLRRTTDYLLLTTYSLPITNY